MQITSFCVCVSRTAWRASMATVSESPMERMVHSGIIGSAGGPVMLDSRRWRVHGPVPALGKSSNRGNHSWWDHRGATSRTRKFVDSRDTFSTIVGIIAIGWKERSTLEAMTRPLWMHPDILRGCPDPRELVICGVGKEFHMRAAEPLENSSKLWAEGAILSIICSPS